MLWHTQVAVKLVIYSQLNGNKGNCVSYKHTASPPAVLVDGMKLISASPGYFIYITHTHTSSDNDRPERVFNILVADSFLHLRLVIQPKTPNSFQSVLLIQQRAEAAGAQTVAFLEKASTTATSIGIATARPSVRPTDHNGDVDGYGSPRTNEDKRREEVESRSGVDGPLW